MIKPLLNLTKHDDNPNVLEIIIPRLTESEKFHELMFYSSVEHCNTDLISYFLRRFEKFANDEKFLKAISEKIKANPKNFKRMSKRH